MPTTRDDNYLSEQFVGWENYLNNHHSIRGEVFNSRGALEWFCRENRDALIKSGQFIPRKGRAGTLYGPLFTHVALGIYRKVNSTNTL